MSAQPSKSKLEILIYHLSTSKLVHQLIFLLYLLSVVALMFISVNPQPFLQYGYFGVFAFNLIGPGTVLIPILAPTTNILILAIISALGMQLNDSVSWVVGRNGQVVFPTSVKRFRLVHWVGKSSPLVMFILSIIPFPYDVIGLVAGYMNMSFAKFFIPALFGKITRFLIIAAIVLYFNINITQYINQLLSNIL